MMVINQQSTQGGNLLLMGNATQPPSTIVEALRDYLKSHGILTEHTDSILNYKPKLWQRIMSNFLFVVGIVLGAFNGKPSAIANQAGFNGFLTLENLPQEGLIYEIWNWLSYYGPYFLNFGIGALASGIVLSQSVYLKEYVQNKGWWNLVHMPVAALSGFSAVYNYILNQKTSTPLAPNIVDTAANGFMRLLSGNTVLLKLYRPLAADVFVYQLTHLCYLIEHVLHAKLQPFYQRLSSELNYGLDITTKKNLARSLAELPVAHKATIAKLLIQEFDIARPSDKDFFWKHKLPQYCGALISFLGGVPLSEVIRQNMGTVWDSLASPATYLFFIDYGREFIRKLLFIKSIFKWYLNAPLTKKIYYGVALPILGIFTMSSIFGSEGLDYDTTEFDIYYLLILSSFTAICTNFLGGLFLINLFAIIAQTILEKCFGCGMSDPHAKIFIDLLSTIEGSNIRSSDQLLEVINKNDFPKPPDLSDDSDEDIPSDDIINISQDNTPSAQTNRDGWFASFWSSPSDAAEFSEDTPLIQNDDHNSNRFCNIM